PSSGKITQSTDGVGTIPNTFRVESLGRPLAPGSAWSGCGRSAGRGRRRSTTTAAPGTSAGRRGQREGSQLTGRLSVDCHENELPVLVDVGHRHAGLTAGHRNLGDVFAGFLIVSVENCTSAGALAANEQRFGDYKAG